MNHQKVEELAVRVIGDMASSFAMGLGYIGDRLGLFRALADAGPLTSRELARRTGLDERYVREWLHGMVAAEYVDHDAETGRFVMTEEQVAVLADDESPFSAGGPLHFTVPTVANAPRLLGAFRSGGGIPYGELGEDIPAAIERLFGPGYTNFLVSRWLPAVPGLVDRLERGAAVLDIGCGCGRSTVTLAAAFPRATVLGLDTDGRSLARARRLAEERRVSNVTFVEAPAHLLPRERPWDLVCAFDCIHDMVDPRAALKAIREALAEDGWYLWSEPNASTNPLENRNPIGKAFACVSPLHCMTVSLAEGGEGLGTIVGERGARALAAEAGFSSFERLPIENPFNQFFLLRR